MKAPKTRELLDLLLGVRPEEWHKKHLSLTSGSAPTWGYGIAGGITTYNTMLKYGQEELMIEINDRSNGEASFYAYTLQPDYVRRNVIRETSLAPELRARIKSLVSRLEARVQLCSKEYGLGWCSERCKMFG